MARHEEVWALVSGDVVANLIVCDADFAALIGANFDAVVQVSDGLGVCKIGAMVGGRYVKDSDEFIPVPWPDPAQA